MMIGRLRVRNGVFLAPMAGITDLPFRTIVREFGCGLAFTEMVSANGLLRGKGRTTRYLDSSPVDRPLGVQLFGSDPATLSDAARIAIVEPISWCGVQGADARPERQPSLVGARAVGLLTVKIRAGWNHRELTPRIGCTPKIAVWMQSPSTAHGRSGLQDIGLGADRVLRRNFRGSEVVTSGIRRMRSGCSGRPSDGSVRGCFRTLDHRRYLSHLWCHFRRHLGREEAIRRHLACPLLWREGWNPTSETSPLVYEVCVVRSARAGELPIALRP
jgi:hypothetical protein